MVRGKVYIAGAGPGDPELMTLKAVRALEVADVVLYDRLVSAEALAMANPAALQIPVGKREGEQERVQAEIYALMAHHASRGRVVVRLKSGDPMVFGRGAEELAFLAEQGIDAEVIPGVSSAIAAPALAGIPLTFRGVASSFAVVTGHCCSGPAEVARLAGVDTLVVLVGVKRRAEIAADLMKAGRSGDTPAAVVERASTQEERVTISTLRSMAANEVAAEAPAVIVIGEVVALRERLFAAPLLVAHGQ